MSGSVFLVGGGIENDPTPKEGYVSLPIQVWIILMKGVDGFKVYPCVLESMVDYSIMHKV